MTYIGIIAAILTSCAFFPQALRVILTKDTRSISLLTYALFTVGIFLWLVYGFYIQDKVVIGANLVTFFPNLIIFMMKAKAVYDEKQKNRSQETSL